MRELNNKQWKALDAFKKARNEHNMQQTKAKKEVLDRKRSEWESVKYG